MESVMVHFNENEIKNELTNEQIQSFAPNAFCKQPTNPNVSTKYVFASTETVIEDMKKLGWNVVEAKQPRKRSSTFRSYHMIAFQNENVKIFKTDENGNKIVDCYPRIILTNSHDGFSSFKFMVGLYRLVCSNGLIIATKEFANYSIRHINYTFEELRELVNSVIAAIPTHIEIMNKMQNKILSNDEQRQLALAGLRFRKNDPELIVSTALLDELLEPTRKEDEGGTLWNTFNILQEKLMNGGFLMEGKTGKVRRARTIKAISKTVSFNQALFREASSLVA